MSASVDPRETMAQFVAYGRAGEWQQALPLIETLCSVFPAEAMLHLHHARTLLALGQPDQARAALAHARQLKPDDGRVLAMQARFVQPVQAPSDVALHSEQVGAVLQRLRELPKPARAEQQMVQDCVNVIVQLAIAPPPILQAVPMPEALQPWLAPTLAQLGAKKFQALGCFQLHYPETPSRHSPLLHAWISPNGDALANAWLVQATTEKLHWLDALLLRKRGRHLPYLAVEVSSLMADGCLLLSNNLGGLLTFTDDSGAEYNKMSRTASTRAVWREHREALSVRARLGIRCQPISAATLSDYVARCHQLRCSARKAVGLVTESELKRYLGRHYALLAGPVRQQLSEVLTGSDFAAMLR